MLVSNPAINAQTVIVETYLGNGNHEINQNTTWSDPVYHIKDDVLIKDGATLTITAGVQIIFFDDQTNGSNNLGNATHTGIFISNTLGSLIVNGTVTNRIIFTANNTSIGWEGLVFEDNAQNIPLFLNTYYSLINYAIIEYVKKPTISTCPAKATNSGAIFLKNFNNIKIENCIIRNNTVNFMGGGIAITDNSLCPTLLVNYPIITNSEIHHNNALHGGGIGIIYATHQVPYIIGNSIHDNAGEQDAGGIAVFKHSTCSIIGNQIFNNKANCNATGTVAYYLGGGGVVVGLASQATINGNIIYKNESNFNPYSSDITGLGGGILVRLVSEASITNNEIHDNISFSGGGIAVFGNKPGVSSTVNTFIEANENNIYGNFAQENGGGILIDHSIANMNFNKISDNIGKIKGGGISVNASGYSNLAPNGPIKIYNNVISTNRADKGAGIFAEGDNAATPILITYIDIINNVISSNQSDEEGGGLFFGENFMVINTNNNTIVKNYSLTYLAGNGLYVPNKYQSSKFNFTNNIIYFNGDINSCQIVYPQYLSEEFIRNNIMHLGCQIDPLNNMDIDPAFVDLNTDDFQLTPMSQMINNGLNSVIPFATQDLINNPRFVYTIDIGAYEYQYPPIIGKPTIIIGKPTNVELLIRPNPFQSEVTIETKEPIESISIYTLDGRNILTKININQIEETLNLSEFESGAYFIEIRSSIGIQIEKLIKQ